MLFPRTELLFWLSIMRDHALFQLSAFAPNETKYIEATKEFRDYFQRTLIEVEKGANVAALKPKLLEMLCRFIDHKKSIVKDLLTCNVKFNLAPTFINHMINEALEFQAFLMLPPPGNTPFLKAMALVELHLKWLADAAGHAASIAAFLDGTEHFLIEDAQKFKEAFEKLLIRAMELQQMLIRTRLSDGALNHLTEEAVEWLKKLIEYLKKLKVLRCACKAMASGATIPLIMDHMIREEIYYLNKIGTYLPR